MDERVKVTGTQNAKWTWSRWQRDSTRLEFMDAGLSKGWFSSLSAVSAPPPLQYCTAYPLVPSSISPRFLCVLFFLSDQVWSHRRRASFQTISARRTKKRPVVHVAVLFFSDIFPPASPHVFLDCRDSVAHGRRSHRV